MHNEEGNVFPLYQELLTTIQKIGSTYEFLYIDDGSTDLSYKNIQILAEQDKNVKYIHFSKNFGHQNAVFAGLEKSSGDAIVIIDADLPFSECILQNQVF